MVIAAPPFIGFSGRPMSQRRDELERFTALLVRHGVRSYLEIGAREGDTFYAVMSALPKGARGVAVDMPGGRWGKRNSRILLLRACRALTQSGYDVRAMFGDSHSHEVVAEVARHAPFDCVFIDADHTYKAVAADWHDYGRFAPIVAFHDIDGVGYHTKDGTPVEVPRLWAELKARYESTRIVGTERGMGIGVVYVNCPLTSKESARCQL